MPKRPYSRVKRSRYSLDSQHWTLNLHAWSDGQAARRGDGQWRPRDVENHAADARRDDGRGADLALYAGSGAAGARDDVRARYFDRADDGVALHGRHRLLADHHGAAVGPLRAAAGAARWASA